MAEYHLGTVTPSLIIDEARKLLGTPYHDHAAQPGIGCDCLGLIRIVYGRVVGPLPVEIPPYAGNWADAGTPDTLIEAAGEHFPRIDPADWQPSDILIFRFKPGVAARHMAIAAGPTTMIHAYERVGVIESTLVPWWRKRIAAVFRFSTPYLSTNSNN